MRLRRLGCAMAGLAVLTACAAACSTSASRAANLQQPPSSIVALGDSVPRGTNCDCHPFPPLTAAGLSTKTGDTVGADNDSVAGATTSSVLRQLTSNESVIDDVTNADVVEIEIGANDVGYSKACGTRVSCYQPRVPSIRKNLAAIVARVHALTSAHKTLVVLLDYWNVWLGGKYAVAKGTAYVDASEEMTDRVDTVIRSTAAATGSAYVDLRAAFKGPDYSYDETHYLSSDGDHPNAAGHRQIASATIKVIEKALRL